MLMFTVIFIAILYNSLGVSIVVILFWWISWKA